MNFFQRLSRLSGTGNPAGGVLSLRAGHLGNRELVYKDPVGLKTNVVDSHGEKHASFPQK